MFSPLIAVVISIPYHSRDPVSALLSLVIHISPLHHVSISPEKYHKPKMKIARTKIGQKYLNQFVFFFFFLFFQLKRKKERKKNFLCENQIQPCDSKEERIDYSRTGIRN